MGLPTVSIPNFLGIATDVPVANAGRHADADSSSVALSTENVALLNAIISALAGTLTVTANVGTGTQPVSGTVTANAGSGTFAVSGPLTDTQLRASAFSVNALQSGTWNIGTVTTVTTVTSLSQFAGNAINLGAGAVGTGTLRTTQASDSPLVTATGAVADTAWTSGSGSLIALLKTIAGAALDVTTASPVKVAGNDEYETVAASASDQALGATGAAGDRLSHVLIVPATTSPGAVSIKDGAGSAITIFTGGASSVSNLVPFIVPLGLKSLAGAWKLTTGTNVAAIACGDFT